MLKLLKTIRLVVTSYGSKYKQKLEIERKLSLFIKRNKNRKMASEFSNEDWPAPDRVAPVRAGKGEDLFEDWPFLFQTGFDNDGDDWGIATRNVRGSELLERYDFPSDPESDAKFISALINAYRTGELVRREEVAG